MLYCIDFLKNYGLKAKNEAFQMNCSYTLVPVRLNTFCSFETQSNNFGLLSYSE